MNGLGYAPVCSSSALSKTCIFRVYGITAPFLRRFSVSVHEKCGSNSETV